MSIIPLLLCYVNITFTNTVHNTDCELFCEFAIHNCDILCYAGVVEELLTKAGLSNPQAGVYLYLLDHGQTAPPLIADALRLTRSNAYKILERLEELGLVHKSDLDKKQVYQAADPTALASLVAEERNRVIALEQTVKDAMQQLRAKYRKSSANSQVTTGTGQTAIINAYEQQIDQKQPIYFVKSRADIPFMGFEAMRRIRQLPIKYGLQRFGITPDGAESPTNPEIDSRSNLTRTWIPQEQYAAPVEWTASGNELLITVFEGEGRLIRIQDAAVAQAFTELWSVIDTNVRTHPTYQAHGPKSKRAT